MTDILPQIIPVVLVTGFLGAGKTTLMNEWLDDENFRDTAVIVNEFGDISIDHDLVRTGFREMMITTTGCICCAASSDVRISLYELLEASQTGKIPSFSRVLIETTGLADPAPIVNALSPGVIPAAGMRDHVVARRFRLASIVACVDVVTGNVALNEAFEAMKQIAFATSILLTKTDLVQPETSPENIAKLKSRLMSINPSAVIAERNDFRNFIPSCFEGCYSAHSRMDDVAGWLALDSILQSNPQATPPARNTRHREDIRATVLMHDGSMTRAALEILLNILSQTAGAQLVRVKGIVKLSDDPARPMLIHAVHHLIHPPKQLAEWPGEDQRTRLVIIGRGYDEEALTSLFNSLTENNQLPRAARDWRRSSVTALGIVTVAVTFAILQSGYITFTSALQKAIQPIGNPP